MSGARPRLILRGGRLADISDELLTSILARTKILHDHPHLRVVCRRTNALLTSSAFREERRESGGAENGPAIHQKRHR